MSPVPLLTQLRDDLGFRRIAHGIATLENLRPEIESLVPSLSDSGIFLGLIAQWVDAGFDSPDLLARLLARFPPAARSAMPLIDYLHLRMAEGVVEMSQEEYGRALAHFRFVQSLEGEVLDSELLAIANFWTGRCLRKTGQYEEALSYVVRGEELALSCGYLPMAAIMQVTRSWLAFQGGRLDEAIAVLIRAEEALRRTDDFLNRGNIQSAHGRIARRQGRFEMAIQCFESALNEYRRGGGGQLQMARTLQNLALVKRLRTLQVVKELDLTAASHRPDNAAPAGPAALLRSLIERARAEAGGHVDESLAIYARSNNHRGIAGGHILRGFLHLDAGDLESAAAEAREAYRHGDEKRDHFVMARARMLQCIVANTAVEQRIGDPQRHREAATGFAREAVSFAGHTQNRRLQARTYVWQGLTFATGPNSDLEAAHRCYDQATGLLQPETASHEYVWEELERLRGIVLDATPIEPRLRAWSAGIVENASFQQITEEFARVVIPKVWEREGRKISRVAEKLSISPKKVRRILQSTGKQK